ncbi:hypothetical protein ILUMI_07705 [Ignelater luminosus]|uniref:Uncharacterized protein n=1 Tax=Ignelater luminosus TaxID=2038154 RepID=A0A8K0GG30_IGNLU|nr:hypothetical protein ILUMI_07705 [Ignelater luminosus]
MDKSKKARALVRAQLKRSDDLLNQEQVDEVTLQVDEVTLQVDDYNNKIFKLMTEDKVGEDENSLIEPSDAVSSGSSSDATSVTGNLRASNNLKYPKITNRKYEGDLKEWLGFWAQFKNMHEDPQLPVSEKFQYLVQSITKRSKAYGVVSSYPQADDNYIKVIEALKKRLGKEEILVEVYVRELLKLFINNNQNSKTKRLSIMFDTLEPHLRSLKFLGVTREKYAAMLFSLVEFSLPDKTLQTWQRSYLNCFQMENHFVCCIQTTDTQLRITRAPTNCQGNRCPGGEVTDPPG